MAFDGSQFRQLSLKDCSSTCPSEKLCSAARGDSVRLPPLMSSLAAQGFVPGTIPPETLVVNARDDRWLASATQYRFKHATDGNKEAALIFYQLPGDIPRFFAVVVVAGRLQFRLSYSERTRSIEKILPPERGDDLEYNEPSAVVPAFWDGNLELRVVPVDAQGQRKCVFWCKLPDNLHKGISCGLGGVAATLISGGNPLVGAGFGVLCLNFFDALQASRPGPGCDEWCKAKETIYCGCPGREGCYHNQAECLDKCSNQGLGCVGKTICGPQPGKCGVPA